MTEPRPFAIVTAVQPARTRGRVWRLPAYLLGLALLVVGIGGLMAFMFVVIATALQVRDGTELDVGEDAELWLWAAGLAVGGYLTLRIGVRLLRGPRRSVLFLRRFGFTDATRVLSDAVVRGLGRRWRLITLDDLRVVPVGTARRNVVVRAAPWLVVLAIVAMIVVVLPGYFDDQIREASDEATAQAQADGEGVLGSLFAGIFAGVVVVIVLFVVVLTPLAVLGALALFGFGANVAVRRAEGRRAVHIERDRQVDRIVGKVEKATSRIYSPRLIVVRCANEVWQAVVRRFAAVTDATLIDVSEASPGLLWELTELGATHSTRWVLVGRQDRLEHLLGDPSPDALRLRAVLAGHTVLAYRPEDPATFQRALPARLTHVP